MLTFPKCESYNDSGVKWIGKSTSPQSLEEVTAEILQLEHETEGLLKRLATFGEVS